MIKSIPIIFLFLYFEGSYTVLPKGILLQGICTTVHLGKRQSPRTVGIPAWKKAAIDRKQFVAKLRKPKSEETIKAEIRLQQKEKEFSMFTTSRIRNLPKEKEFETRYLIYINHHTVRLFNGKLTLYV